MNSLHRAIAVAKTDEAFFVLFVNVTTRSTQSFLLLYSVLSSLGFHKMPCGLVVCGCCLLMVVGGFPEFSVERTRKQSKNEKNLGKTRNLESINPETSLEPGAVARRAETSS